VELADTSAWSIAHRATDADLLDRFEAGLLDRSIATCDMVRFELLLTARNPADFTELAEDLAAVADCPIGKRQWQRALSVYRSLAEQGGAHQRSVGHADLLIAAAAESAGATILHYDEDYERIVEITGQPARWIVPRGSL
jgi:predicted nucleic acid-binding protein